MKYLTCDLMWSIVLLYELLLLVVCEADWYYLIELLDGTLLERTGSWYSDSVSGKTLDHLLG